MTFQPFVEQVPTSRAGRKRGSTTEVVSEGKPRATRRAHRSSGFFPLWSYGCCRDEVTGSTNFNLLILLHDYRFVPGSKHARDPRKALDHVAPRLLLGLMRYDRFGSDETLDVPPFLPWDRKADGYRTFSFLWRFCWNERKADGSRAIDLFFIPIVR